MSHNFNTQHPATWTWSADDLAASFLRTGITFRAGLHDAGSDDLLATWEFGDGTSAIQTFYNDGVGADPAQSQGGRAPFDMAAVLVHGYTTEGPFVVTLTLQDDDGGLATATVSIGVPGLRSMYSSARFMFSCLPGSGAEAGSGTRPLIDSTSSGLVPQVTIGAISAAFSVKVTDLPAIGLESLAFVSTAETVVASAKSPVAGLTVKVVAAGPAVTVATSSPQMVVDGLLPVPASPL